MKHKITCDSFNHGMGLFEEIKKALKDCGSEVVKLKIEFDDKKTMGGFKMIVWSRRLRK